MSIRKFFKNKTKSEEDADTVQHANFKGTRFSSPRFLTPVDQLLLPKKNVEGMYAFVGGSFNVREDLLFSEAHQNMLAELTLEPWVSPGAPGKRKNGGGGPTYPIYDTAKLSGSAERFVRLPRAFGLEVFNNEVPSTGTCG